MKHETVTHTPDLDEAKRFLKELDPTAERFTFQTFDDDKDRKNGKLARVLHGTVDAHADTLSRLQAQGAGVFVTINETDLTGRKAENIKRVRACFVDLDGAPLQPVLDWEPPHIVVDTSPGRFHAYWRVDGLELDEFTPMQKALIERFDADKNVKDLPRVMRLPGFWHQKGTPTKVKMEPPNAFWANFPAETWRKRIADLTPALPLSQLAATSGIDVGDTPDIENVRQLLSEAPNDLDRNNWIKLAAALKAEFGEALRGDFLTFSARYRGDVDPKEDQQAWNTLTPNGTAKIGSIFHLLRPSNLPERNVQKPATNFRQPELDLVRDAKDRPIWNTANAVAILTSHPEWQDVLAYDEFQARNMLLRPIPGDAKRPFEPRELRDADLTAILVWFNRNGFPHATRTAVSDAVHAITRQTIISPVRHYLEDLTWDGTERIDRWLIDYCGAQDSLYTQEAGRCWLISAVARALNPGCKADSMLILEGAQGVGKSSIARIMAHDDWFGDALPDMGGKDAASYLRGKWIVEVAELVAVRRSEIEQVKAFLTRQEERFRPAYGRAEVFEPRRCVFIGTTNRSDYLRDETGNRRFWPVRLGDIDLEQIKRDRDQLWAEAVEAFRMGAHWWLSAEVEEEAIEAQAERGEDDPWEAVVSDYVISKDEVSCSEILHDKLLILPADQTKAHAHRVAGLLQRAGFERAQKPNHRFTSGTNKGRNKYVRFRG